ncbi:pas sensor protein [Sporocytophaga myxococcoides]|uniref:Pas sensor protein n=1 Tax=Sporocytophaga myxococcoides TaxID=153721 RepID=A0A098LGE7_9BACT|nr:PAS domain-containing protein [Sporocytophaga myxococcoides]GAL85512.1 pas sensor protein [Sporocytophaga myxococcoides]
MSSDNSFKSKYNKLLISTISATIFLACILVYTIISIKKSKENASDLSKALFNLSQYESSFRNYVLNVQYDTISAITGENMDISSLMNYARLFQKDLSLLEENLKGKDRDTLLKIKANYDTLNSVFLKVSQLFNERGFKNHGIEGKMHQAAHILEKSPDTDKGLVLTLRKHEKDFFIKKEKSYIGAFDQTVSDLENQITSLPDSDTKNYLNEALRSYQTTFHEIVEIESVLGLEKNQGLIGFLYFTTNQSINKLDILRTLFENKSNNLLSTTLLAILFLSLGLIALIYWVLNKFIKPAFDPIHEIQIRATEISEGNLSVKFDEFSNNNMLKDLITGLEKIVFRFKTTMNQVEAISSRKILTELPLTSDKDEVGKTVNLIIRQLKNIDDDEQQRAWHNEGLAMFANLLRIYINDADTLYDNFLREMVKYIDANQGGLFILEDEDDEESYMLMKACYAYDRKKFINKKINEGEGLAGVCWQEGETIFMTEIPNDYMYITSGVGGASPSSLVIVPVKFNDKIFGVIELASFKIIPNHQIKFIEAIAESFGSTVHNMKTGTKTRSLLEQSQIMTEELRAQEEEMRQNMEELQATQEEMERNVSSLKSMTKELEVRERIFGLTTILSEADKYGTILDINSKFVEVSGYSREELIGKPHNILRDPEMPKELFKLFWDTIKSGNIFKGIIKNRGKGGIVYWVNATIVPIKDEDGNIVKYIGARYHIEDEKFAEYMYNKQASVLGHPLLKTNS